MKIMQETTGWSDGGTGNHVYVFNDSMTQAIAYVPAGSKILKRFKSPLKIDIRGRTFVELEDGSPTAPDPDVITVEGSRGEKYFLSKTDDYWVCTCPGFKFRGQCKHVAEMQQP